MHTLRHISIFQCSYYYSVMFSEQTDQSVDLVYAWHQSVIAFVPLLFSEKKY